MAASTAISPLSLSEGKGRGAPDRGKRPPEAVSAGHGEVYSSPIFILQTRSRAAICEKRAMAYFLGGPTLGIFFSQTALKRSSLLLVRAVTVARKGGGERVT